MRCQGPKDESHTFVFVSKHSDYLKIDSFLNYFYNLKCFRSFSGCVSSLKVGKLFGQETALLWRILLLSLTDPNWGTPWDRWGSVI